MNNIYYFSHDTNARNDEKILCLRAEYGMEGYGVFFALLEMMYVNENTALNFKSLKGFAYELRIDVEKLKAIIDLCIEVGLFETDGEKFWSNSLLRRKNVLLEVKQKRAEAGRISAQLRKKKKERAETTNELSDEAYEFANYFKSLIPSNVRITDATLKSWADTYDKLIRIDKKNRDEIYEVVRWARNDSFWSKNFLSANKLRQKTKDGIIYYDLFVSQMKGVKPLSINEMIL